MKIMNLLRVSIASFLLVTANITIFSQDLEIEGKAKITEMDTVIADGNMVIKLNDGTLAVRRYKVGDYVHGGVVFWVNITGDHGLVVDTADIGELVTWYNGVDKVINSRGDGIRAGFMNTSLIVAQQTQDNTNGVFAALLCANHNRNDYGDWYLPSRLELDILYDNRNKIDSAFLAIGANPFPQVYYWSSTEKPDDGTVWNRWFKDGVGSGYGSKNNTFNVRAIRSF